MLTPRPQFSIFFHTPVHAETGQNAPNNSPRSGRTEDAGNLCADASAASGVRPVSTSRRGFAVSVFVEFSEPYKKGRTLREWTPAPVVFCQHNRARGNLIPAPVERCGGNAASGREKMPQDRERPPRFCKLPYRPRNVTNGPNYSPTGKGPETDYKGPLRGVGVGGLRMSYERTTNGRR